MTVAEQIYEQVKTLPEALAREVLDLVEFLSERPEIGSWHDLMEAQTSGLRDVWDNAEDAIWEDV